MIIWRKIISSGREVPTVEYSDEPGFFYVYRGKNPCGDYVSGPYCLDDRRFSL